MRNIFRSILLCCFVLALPFFAFANKYRAVLLSVECVKPVNDALGRKTEVYGCLIPALVQPPSGLLMPAGDIPLTKKLIQGTVVLLEKFGAPLPLCEFDSNKPDEEFVLFGLLVEHDLESMKDVLSAYKLSVKNNFRPTIDAGPTNLLTRLELVANNALTAAQSVPRKKLDKEAFGRFQKFGKNQLPSKQFESKEVLITFGNNNYRVKIRISRLD